MFSSFPSLAHFSFCLVSPSDLIESLGFCYCLFTADFQIFYLWLRTWSPESKPIASEWPIRNLYLDDPQACLKFISSSFISWFSYDQERSIWMNDTPQARLGRHSQVLLHSCSQYFIWSCCFNCLTSQIHWFLSISADNCLSAGHFHVLSGFSLWLWIFSAQPCPLASYYSRCGLGDLVYLNFFNGSPVPLG